MGQHIQDKKTGEMRGQKPGPGTRPPSASDLPAATSATAPAPAAPSLTAVPEQVYAGFQSHLAQTTPTAAPSAPIPVPPGSPIALTGFTINQEYPYPKVNNLAKMLQALEAVAGGACTDDAVAEAIGSRSDREGSYHATNLGYLGLAVAGSPVSGGPREWMLTPQGVQMLEGSPADRVAIMRHLIGQFPDIAAVQRPDGEEYAPGTMDRRSASVPAWEREIDKAQTGGSAFHRAAADAVAGRLDRARAVVAEQRARHAAPPPPKTCTQCHMALPATGRCDTCDD